MKKVLLFTLLLPGIINAQLGQKEAAQWRFGKKCALNFLGGSPLALNTGSTTISTHGSSGVISDSLGNLLFYLDDAYRIFDKNNTVMANGLDLAGPTSSFIAGAQSGLVLRKAGNIYYVFTNNYSSYTSSPPLSEINYHIVDMGLASGAGSVTAKTLSLSPINTRMASKLAGTLHCNKRDHWVLAHTGALPGAPGTNQYYAYLAGSSSVNINPVITAIGSNQPNNYGNYVGYYRGIHKFSPNGRKVAATMIYRTVELFDFNPGTGQLSNLIRLDSIAAPSPSYEPYDANTRGLEFSPDGTKLYVTYANFHPVLCQFDLCAGSASAIAASKTVICADTLFNYVVGCIGMQLAPDGKIYVTATSTLSSHSNSLSVINNPNAQGILCNYTPFSVALNTLSTYPYAYGESGAGLPNFESNFFEQKPQLPLVNSGTIVCGLVNFASPILPCPATGYSVSSYFWNFGDPLSSNNTSGLVNPGHQFTSNGTYTVKLTLNYYPCGADTLKQIVNISGLPNVAVSGKTSLCKGESTVLSFTGASSFTINGIALTQGTTQLTPSITTTYTLIATNTVTGCSSTSTVIINVYSCLGLSNLESINTPFVYPNPNTGLTTIELLNKCELSLHNALSQEVFTATLPAGVHQLNMAQLSSGIYFLHWKTTEGKGCVKIIKE
ncbi:MAG TPA: T9SS type A sorting domain-containing protein [Bacteroidia bacterium]|nr:T9SS type A sorting domain-containing protein [Bacteroidia bacterium]